MRPNLRLVSNQRDVGPITDEENLSDVVLKDRNAEPWLRDIERAQAYYREYNTICDKVDKELGNLKVLGSNSNKKAFQLFYANIEVLKPTIYSRPPVPIVEPVFKTTDEKKTLGAQLLERALMQYIRMTPFHRTMGTLTDDMVVCGRAVPWVRLKMEQGPFGETVAAVWDAVKRSDYLQSPCRGEAETRWRARAGHLTKEQMKARFQKTSKGAWRQATFEQRNLAGGDSQSKTLDEKTAIVWEIWHKEQNVVVWVSPDVKEVLDAKRPYMKLENFWPCPEPAVSFMQRDTSLPIPDYLFYRDQITEINDLTSRISAQMQALRVKGFYAGAGKAAQAIETAWRQNDDNALLIAVGNLGDFGAGAGKLVEWMPVLEIAQTIAQLVEERRRLIDDVYQLTGLSDIMRGATEASETATAQQLKAEFGSIRVRNRQDEMVRIGAEGLRHIAELMAEHYEGEVLREMAQMREELPTRAEVQYKINELVSLAEQAMQQVTTDEQAAQVETIFQTELQKLTSRTTLEDVMGSLRNDLMRPYVLKVETDSTIQPNEDAEKQRRLEYMEIVGGLFEKVLPVAQAAPEVGPFLADTMKFVNGGFRAGRDMDKAVEEFGDQLLERAEQAKTAEPPPDPDMLKLEIERERIQAEIELKREEIEVKKMEAQAKLAPPGVSDNSSVELAFKENEAQRKHELELAKIEAQRASAEMEADAKVEIERAKIEAENHRLEREIETKKQIERDKIITNVIIEKAKLEVASENGKEDGATASKGEVAVSSQDNSAREELKELLHALSSSNEELVKAITAPKKLTFDANGEPIGVESARG